MAWDPALLRKYNTTSHFRLLNQIRTELREQPIQRPLVTSRNPASGFGGGGRRGGRAGGGTAGVSGSAGSSTAGAQASSAATNAPAVSSGGTSTQAASSHSNTRRRSGASSTMPTAASSAPRDHQPIVAVPVLTDVVMPDSHA